MLIQLRGKSAPAIFRRYVVKVYIADMRFIGGESDFKLTDDFTLMPCVQDAVWIIFRFFPQTFQIAKMALPVRFIKTAGIAETGYERIFTK